MFIFRKNHQLTNIASIAINFNQNLYLNGDKQKEISRIMSYEYCILLLQRKKDFATCGLNYWFPWLFLQEDGKIENQIISFVLGTLIFISLLCVLFDVTRNASSLVFQFSDFFFRLRIFFAISSVSYFFDISVKCCIWKIWRVSRAMSC